MVKIVSVASCQNRMLDTAVTWVTLCQHVCVYACISFLFTLILVYSNESFRLGVKSLMFNLCVKFIMVS